MASTANNANLISSLTTDFNVTPYYDDFNSGEKDFYRLLFKPGYAIQARELTQIQSMIQSQIFRFGKHVFKEGSIVIPGQFEFKMNIGTKKGLNISYVKIKNVDNDGNDVDVNKFVGQTLTGLTSSLTAVPEIVLDTDGTDANTKTLYFSSYNNAKDGDPTIRVFQDGEILTSNVGSCVVVDSGATGYASWFGIQEGVVFAKDHFISFPTQSTILERYNPNPSVKVGFYVTEEIVNSTQDTSLLDPALEASNYAAPGADRLKLTATLSVRAYGDEIGAPNFVTLFTVKDGVVQISNDLPQYNILGDTLARRTNEESGDYIVKGYNVSIQEHDNISGAVPNYGRFETGNNQELIVATDPGHGYCKGYPIRNLDRYEITIPKPQNYLSVNTQIASASQGQYVFANEFVGTWELDKGNRINLYDQVERRITNGGSYTGQKWSTGSQSGAVIGTAIVNSVQYDTGTPGYDAVYKVYLSDIRMSGSNTFSNVRSLYYNTSPSALGADILGANNTTTNTKLQAVNQSALLYYTGANYIKTVRDFYGNPSTIYYFNETQGVSVSASFTIAGKLPVGSLLSGGSGEELPYTVGQVISATDVKQDFIVTVGASLNIGPLWGAATVQGFGNNYLRGVSTTFTHFNVGDKIEISGVSSNTWYITSITNDTNMYLSNNVPASVTSGKIFKAYKKGDILNLTGKGIRSGETRTITMGGDTNTFEIDLKEDLPATMNAAVTYKVSKTEAQEAKKYLRPSRLVYIDCSTAGTSGPFCLGFSDVYQIKSVTKNSSPPSAVGDGTDVTKYFRLDNGQRDDHYELASIRRNGISLTGSDHLLVELDYFEPAFTGRSGYFSINSYTIQDDDTQANNTTIRTENIPVYVSPSSGAKYDLRNHLDFRPVKSPTATDATTIGSASTNPSNTSLTYSYVGSGMKFPVPSTDLIYDYSYYVGRKDIVVVNQDGRISVSQGTPGVNPVIPNVLDTQMLVAILDIAPYPSLSPAYGNVLQRRDLSCGSKKVTNRVYTMRDIGILDQRIKNLEYYTALTLLEKDALNYKILDADGNDRFKNGYFIDTFKDASLSAKETDPDFRIKFDATELSIRPLFTIESFGYEPLSTIDVTIKQNKAYFDYTEELFFDQPRVTTERNLERGTYYYQGRVELFPDKDVWVDTTFAADEVVTISANNTLLAVSTSNEPDVAAAITKSFLYTDWGDWQTTVVGYDLYRGQGAAKVYVGRYNSLAAAQAQAAQWTTSQNGGAATVVTIYNNTRLGTNWFANESSDTAAGSTKLISSDKIPYIRKQEVVVRVQGLKPYSKMYVFFDGVNVSKFCTPLTAEQFQLALNKQPLPLDKTSASTVENIVDTTGNLYFIFKLTDNPKFKTGDRKILVTDSEQIDPDTISATEDASTVASGYFFADGTKQTLQRTVYSTEGYLKTGESTSQAYQSESAIVMPNTWTPPPKAGHCCFNPEAKVLMADLTWKAIRDVEAGDKVIGDHGVVNTVTRNNVVKVGDRKMMQFNGTSFYTTDDHLFLTSNGWKTWDPQHVMHDLNTRNKEFLVGDNQVESINSQDLIKTYKLVDDKLTYSYGKFEATSHDFDHNYEVHDLSLEGNLTYIVEGFVAHNCCAAYTVLIKAPEDEEGIFVTSFDIFVARKSQTRPLWFELREMDSAGNITDVVIPGSVVYVENADIPVSNNGYTNPCNVKFPAPIFLFNNKPYGFVVHSLAAGMSTIDPDTQIWISRLGGTDKQTGAQVTERMKMGTFFQTTNNKQWSDVKDVDLTMKVYRAKFKAGTGTLVIGQQPVEKFLLSNVSNSLKSRVGDHFVTGDTLTISSLSGSNTISVGDKIVGNVSLAAASGNVIYQVASDKYTVSNTRYKIGESISVFNSSGISKGISGIVTGIANGSAQLSYYDDNGPNVYAEFITSTGGFIQNNVIQSVRDSGYDYRAKVDAIKDFRYSVVSFEPMVLDFVRTGLKYEMQTYANGSTTASSYQQLNPSDTTYFDDDKVLYSRTNELSLLGGDRSNKIKVTLESNSEYVSPVFDIAGSHTLFIDNLISSNVYNETAASGGYAINKYISQTVTLADGQDAEDIQVILSAYRPPRTDVKVYVKITEASDPVPFAQKPWIELVKQGTGDSLYSSLANRLDFKEFSYGFDPSIMTGKDGAVSYTFNGIPYSGFKYYAIKIVLISEIDSETGVVNAAVVPRVADLRAIALQI